MQVGQVFKPGEVFSGPSEALARVLRIPGISHGAALALWLLVNKIGRNESCWHRQELLAAELQVSVRTFQRLIGELRTLGLIQYEQRGIGRSCRYETIWHDAWTADLKTAPARRSARQKRPAAETPRPARHERRTEVLLSSSNLSQSEQLPAPTAPTPAVPASQPETPKAKCYSRLDDDEPRRDYASPEDELKAIFEAKTKTPMPAQVLRTVTESLELRAVPLPAYVAELRRHTGGRWTNPPGLLIALARQFYSRTRPSPPPKPPQVEQPPCRCGGGGYISAEEFCTCLMGREVSRVHKSSPVRC